MKRERKHNNERRSRFLRDIGVPEPKPFLPDPFQLEAIESLKQGKDTLVIAPTGTGKTYIAVKGIAEIIAQKKRAIYTAPLKALSNTKYSEFKRLFEPEYSVGLLTGDRKIDGDADVVVATTEIYRNELYNYGENYALVVLDELHYLADPQRGPVWEESIILSPRSATLLMLSASISNPYEIAAWIGEVRKREVHVIVEKERLVELRLGFLHPDLGVLPLEDERGRVLPEIMQFYAEGGRGGHSERGRRFEGGSREDGPGRRPKRRRKN